MQQVMKEKKRPTVRRSRRAIAVLIPAALLGIAATGYTVLKPDEVVAAGIGCYASVSETDSDVTVVSTTGGDPIKVCRELWAKGEVNGSREVPELTACINTGGAVSVFPSGDENTCTRLGLQALPDGYRMAARRFAKMSDDVFRQLYKVGTKDGIEESQVCLNEETALSTVRGVLDKHGFSDWTAAINRGDYRDRVCMNGIAFDDVEKMVLIIPTEPGMIPWHRDPTM